MMKGILRGPGGEFAERAAQRLAQVGVGASRRFTKGAKKEGRFRSAPRRPPFANYWTAEKFSLLPIAG